MPTSRGTTRVEPPAAGPPRRRTSFTGRALVLLLVVAVLGVSYASSIRAWLNQRSEEHSLSAQVAAERAAIAQLKAQKARWNDPAYIEEQARLRFGWVMPGERSYRVIGTDGKVLSTGSDVLSEPLTAGSGQQAPWWSGAVGSVREADAVPPAHPKHQVRRQPATLIGRAPHHPPGH